MYLYQPCLLSLSLYAWAFCEAPNGRRRMLTLFPLFLLLVSEAEWTGAYLQLYPAGLLLPGLFLERKRKPIDWPGVLSAAILSGLLGWKLGDAFPLSPLVTPLGALLMLGPIAFLCRQERDRRLAICLAGLAYELFFCLREYVLFSYCLIRLGSRAGLSLSAAALCAYNALSLCANRLAAREKHGMTIRN